MLTVVLFSGLVLGSNAVLKFLPLKEFSFLTANCSSSISLNKVFAEPARNFLTDSPDVVFSQENSILGYAPHAVVNPQVLGSLSSSSQNKEIREYLIKEGDTISSLAEEFDISVETILWANDLSSSSIIKPGEELLILPTSGVLYMVKKGDTLSTIAQRYKGDVEEMVSYNSLESEEDIFVGDIILIPGGKEPKETPKISSAPIADSYFMFPCEGEISQGLHGAFGNAIDIANKCGKPVVAAAGGTVQRAGWITIGGQRVTILHSNGVVSYYGHLSAINVVPGQKVNRGEIIGYIGNTGYTIGMTGCHLHFEVRGARNFLSNYSVGSHINW